MTANAVTSVVRPLALDELERVYAGFTLIELIVPIPIIAVLIGLLVPAVQPAHPVHK